MVRDTASPKMRRHDAPKRERVDMRLTPEQKTLIQQAAALEGRSLSDFILTSAASHAEAVIRARRVLQLTAEDSLAFARAVLDDAPPNDKLNQAARLRDELIGS